jgi:protoheme IX farnesyltransferase
MPVTPAMISTTYSARLKTLAALTRIKLSIAVAVSAVAGFVAACHTISFGAFYTFVGVALLSASASVLNQVQEKDLDARMERTKNRPLVTHQISIPLALAISLVSAVAGFAILFAATTTFAALLGVFTLFWYNAVYTPLKRKTLIALPVGALTGALAPIIGCVAANNRLDATAVGIGFFLFFWQVPHFLLLLLKYGPEYQKAGYPYMAQVKHETRFRYIVFLWLVATSVSTLLFPLYGFVSLIWLVAVLIGVNILFISYYFVALIKNKKPLDLNAAFRFMYVFQACILLVLVVQALLP